MMKVSLSEKKQCCYWLFMSHGLFKMRVNWKVLQVSLVNDGPVTMQVDSPSLQGAAQSRRVSFPQIIRLILLLVVLDTC
jgi:hypothetical protein